MHAFVGSSLIVASLKHREKICTEHLLKAICMLFSQLHVWKLVNRPVYRRFLIVGHYDASLHRVQGCHVL